MTTQLTGRPPTRSSGRASTRGWVRAGVVAVSLGFGIFLLYFLAYPTRHLSLPMGFDPAYYMWRAQYLASQGIGSGQVAARPGYPVLSAMMGSLTGLPQLRLTAVLSLILVPLLALAAGAFVSAGLGVNRWRWSLTVATAGIVVGATHLVGENLSNTLNIALEVAALVPLAWAVSGSRGLWGSVALLVASGMAHWDFLALFGVVLAVVFAMFLSRSRAEVALGASPLDTEAGVIAAAGVATAVVVSALVGAVLRAPFKTIELGNDQLLFRRKFRTDAVRLGVPAAAALVGASALPSLHLSTGDSEAQYRRRRFALSVLGAWTYVMAAGIVLGLLTLVLPPARFLAHLVAFPGAVAVALFVAAGSVWVGRRLRSPRWGRIAAVAIAVVALGLLAVPGILRWYRYPVLMDARALQEARTAGGYVRMLPAGQPVIFVVDYAGGKPGVYGPVMSERTLRIAVPAERALDVHLYVGSPADLLAGRRTPPPDERSDRVTLSYWRDVQPLLSLDPPVLVLQAMAGPQFEAVRHTGATVIAPGVALLRGPKPLAPLSPVGPAPPWVPSLWSGLGWGAAVLVLLFIAGVGWSLVIVPTTSPPETVVSMMPVVGAGSLILGGLLAALAGVHLGTWGGVGTYLVVAFAGGSAAVLDRRRLARRPPRAPGETRR